MVEYMIYQERVPALSVRTKVMQATALTSLHPLPDNNCVSILQIYLHAEAYSLDAIMRLCSPAVNIVSKLPVNSAITSLICNIQDQKTGLDHVSWYLEVGYSLYRSGQEDIYNLWHIAY